MNFFGITNWFSGHLGKPPGYSVFALLLLLAIGACGDNSAEKGMFRSPIEKSPDDVIFEAQEISGFSEDSVRAFDDSALEFEDILPEAGENPFGEQQKNYADLFNEDLDTSSRDFSSIGDKAAHLQDPGGLDIQRVQIAFLSEYFVLTVPAFTTNGVALARVTLELRNSEGTLIFGEEKRFFGKPVSFSTSLGHLGNLTLMAFGVTVEGLQIEPLIGIVQVQDSGARAKLILDVPETGGDCSILASASSTAKKQVYAQICPPNADINFAESCVRGPMSAAEAAQALAVPPQSTDSCWNDAPQSPITLTLEGKDNGTDQFVVFGKFEGQIYSGAAQITLAQSKYPIVFVTEPKSEDFAIKRGPGDTLKVSWMVQDDETLPRDLKSMLVLRNRKTGDERILACNHAGESADWPSCPKETRQLATDESTYTRTFEGPLPADWISADEYELFIVEVDSQGQSQIAKTPPLQGKYEVIAGQAMAPGSSAEVFQISSQRAGSLEVQINANDELFFYWERGLYLKVRGEDGRTCVYLRSQSIAPSVFDCPDVKIFPADYWSGSHSILNRPWLKTGPNEFHAVTPKGDKIFKFSLSATQVTPVSVFDARKFENTTSLGDDMAVDGNLAYNGKSVFFQYRGAIFKITEGGAKRILGRIASEQRAHQECLASANLSFVGGSQQLEGMLPCFNSFGVSQDGRIHMTYAYRDGGSRGHQFIFWNVDFDKPEDNQVSFAHLKGKGGSSTDLYVEANYHYLADRNAFVAGLAWTGPYVMALPDSKDEIASYTWQRLGPPGGVHSRKLAMDTSGVGGVYMFLSNRLQKFSARFDEMRNIRSVSLEQKIVVNDASSDLDRARILNQAFSLPLPHPLWVAVSADGSHVYVSNLSRQLFHLDDASALAKVRLLDRSFGRYPFALEEGSRGVEMLSFKRRSASSFRNLLPEGVMLNNGDPYAFLRYSVEKEGDLTLKALQVLTRQVAAYEAAARETFLPVPHRAEGWRAEIESMSYSGSTYGVGRGGTSSKIWAGISSQDMTVDNLSSSDAASFELNGESHRGERLRTLYEVKVDGDAGDATDQAELAKHRTPQNESDYNRSEVTYWKKNSNGGAFVESQDARWSQRWQGYGFSQAVGSAAYSTDYSHMYSCVRGEFSTPRQYAPSKAHFALHELKPGNLGESRHYPYEAIDSQTGSTILCDSRYTHFRNEEGVIYILTEKGREGTALYRLTDGTQIKTKNLAYFTEVPLADGEEYAARLNRAIGGFDIAGGFIYYTHIELNQLIRNKLGGN